MNKCVVGVYFAANGKVGIDNPYERTGVVTSINGPKEEVEKYYAIGKTFNIGYWSGHEDNLMHVTEVLILPENEETKRFIDYLGEKYGWDWKDHFRAEEYEMFRS